MIKNVIYIIVEILAAYHTKHQITNDSCYLTKHQMISGFMGQLLRFFVLSSYLACRDAFFSLTLEERVSSLPYLKTTVETDGGCSDQHRCSLMRQLLWLLILSSAVVCKIDASRFADAGKIEYRRFKQ
jgi:hypothetical protein